MAATDGCERLQEKSKSSIPWRAKTWPIDPLPNMECMSNACEYTGIRNAPLNTPRRPCPGGCVRCYVSTLGSAMHCSTPQTTMPRWLCAVLCEYTGIRNALFNTRRRPCPGGCVGCYVSTLGSGMHCSTPQTTMPRWL